MTSPQAISQQVSGLVTQLTSLQTSLTNSYNESQTQTVPLTQTNQKQSQKIADILFEEQEALRQANGSKRAQTLQEYVLNLFYISYLLFTVTLLFYTMKTLGLSSALKIFGLMLLILLCVTGVILRYG